VKRWGLMGWAALISALAILWVTLIATYTPPLFAP
jgi:hypothetical protein